VFERQHLTAAFAAVAALAMACGGGTQEQEQEQGADVGVAALSGPPLVVAGVQASADDGNVPANVLDGDLATRWSCEGVGCRIRADLGTARVVTGLAVAWYQGRARSNAFTIATSSDGKAYTQVLSGRSSGTTTALERYAVPAVTARYVKLTVNGNTVNDWASVTELRVLGTATGATACTSFTYSAWAPTPCSGGTQTRTVLSSSPAGCTGGSPVLSQACADATSTPVTSGLVGVWPFDGSGAGTAGGADARSVGDVQYVAGKNGMAATFNGQNYLEIPDSDSLSPASSGEKITIAFWLNPATFNFTGENAGYVNFLGKGVSGQHEWTFRIYNSTAQDGGSRAKRVSFYAFNLSGGLGAGSYFQDDLATNEWIFVTGVIDGVNTHIYKNGVERDVDPLSGYSIQMGNGTAPLRIGSRDGESYFQGSIDNLRIYDRALSTAEINQLYQADLAAH
jgi:hypothetical protein